MWPLKEGLDELVVQRGVHLDHHGLEEDIFGGVGAEDDDVGERDEDNRLHVRVATRGDGGDGDSGQGQHGGPSMDAGGARAAASCR